MNKLMESWKRFLNEDLLAEGRLQDAKKKYPDHAEYIDAMSAKDPSGNNKYLMWMAKQFNTDASNFSMSDQGKKIYVDTITDLVSKFHKSVQRLEKKDINQYETLDELDDTLEKLGATSKEKRQKKKEVAQEGSRIVYESDEYFVVRPETEEASCYYGQNTQWCISATESSNYFEDYTQRGKAFYMIRNNYKSDKDPNKRIALVYSDEYGYSRPEEIFDATDDQISLSSLEEALGDEYDDILDAAKSDLEEHGAGTNMTEEFDRIVEETRGEMKYTELGWDDAGFGEYYFTAQSYFNLEDFLGVSSEQLEEEDIYIETWVREAIDEIRMYDVDEVEVNGDEVSIYYRFDDVSRDVPGFEKIAEEAKYADEQISTELRNYLLRALAEEGLGKASGFGDLSKRLEQMKLKNFDFEEDDDDSTLDVGTIITVPLEQIRLFLQDRGVDVDSSSYAELVQAVGKEVTGEAFKKDFLKDIRAMLQKDIQAAAQVSLPGIEKGDAADQLEKMVFDNLEQKFRIKKTFQETGGRPAGDVWRGAGKWKTKGRYDFDTLFRFSLEDVSSELAPAVASFFQKLDDSHDEYEKIFQQSVSDVIMDEVNLKKVAESIELKRKVMKELKERGIL
jgi:hypothetical protein